MWAERTEGEGERGVACERKRRIRGEREKGREREERRT